MQNTIIEQTAGDCKKVTLEETIDDNRRLCFRRELQNKTVNKILLKNAIERDIDNIAQNVAKK